MNHTSENKENNPFIELNENIYENITFNHCDFSGIKLNDKEFIECTFNDCNLSNVHLKNTGLKDVRFIRTKMIGIDFALCQDFLFAVSFEKCLLDFSSFIRNKLKKTLFENCSVREASFVETDLTEARFINCDLFRTTFENNNLSGTDFRTALNYSIDMDNNKMKHARFSYPGVLGLLDKYYIKIEE